MVERVVDVDEVEGPIPSSRTETIKTKFKHPKLDYCKDELKNILEKLIENNYHSTAEIVFNSIAYTGVETDANPELKSKPTMEEFLKSE